MANKSKGYSVKKKGNSPKVERATGTRQMGVRKPNKAEGRSKIRKTSQSAYGSTPRSSNQAPIEGKVTPKRKAKLSEVHPDRKTRNTNRETFVGNSTWRKAKYSIQHPERAKKAAEVRKAAKKVIKKR